MSFASLALIAAIGLLGPVLAVESRWRLPVVLGEIVAGFLAGPALLGLLHPDEPTFGFLAAIGFALVMFVTGTHVPVRDPRLRDAARIGAVRVVLVGALAVVAGLLIAAVFDTGHGLTYAVVLASSSAALILPAIGSVGLSGPAVIELLPQVAIADTACILVLQAVMQSGRATGPLLGGAAVIVVAGLLYALLQWLERSGWRRRVHRVSEDRKFAVELRVNLAILFGLAAVAVTAGASVLQAGFAFGIVVADVAEPRRLARQLFALTEGFFGPLFFVWLGASLSTTELWHHLSFILLGLALGGAAVLIHLAPRLTGQPLVYGSITAAQLGVPVAAATIGTQQQLLLPGESAALVIGALITVGASVAGTVIAGRAERAP
jgi:Kef-type K+ transport system membrane component KefB